MPIVERQRKIYWEKTLWVDKIVEVVKYFKKDKIATFKPKDKIVGRISVWGKKDFGCQRSCVTSS